VISSIPTASSIRPPHGPAGHRRAAGCHLRDRPTRHGAVRREGGHCWWRSVAQVARMTGGPVRTWTRRSGAIAQQAVAAAAAAPDDAWLARGPVEASAGGVAGARPGRARSPEAARWPGPTPTGRSSATRAPSRARGASSSRRQRK
jgi:hypothetical protein